MNTSSNVRLSAGRRQPFLTVSELRERLAEPAGPLLVDARAERQYRQGHLPEAVNLPARELNPVEDGVRRLVEGKELRRRLARFRRTDELVVYGARGGADAAHSWWTLRAFGLGQVCLLDGGIEAWQEEGGALVSAAEQVPERSTDGLGAGSDFEVDIGLASPEGGRPLTVRPEAVVSRAELLRKLDDPSTVIVDTRELEEFSGELMAARRGGHVPGAILFPWTNALDPGLRLRSEDELRQLLAPVLEKPEAIIYCQSGVRAAHTLAVLEMLGHPRPRLYLGSWGEWGNRDDTPVEVEAGV